MLTRFNDQIDDDFGPYGDKMWDLLNLYADGEASPEEAARVEKLLRSDAAYARQLGFVKTTTAAVQSFAELDPPSSLRGAIFASTSQRVTWAARLMSLLDGVPRFATSLAGLAAAGLLAFVVVQHNSSPSRNGTPRLAQEITQPAMHADTAVQSDLTENVEPSFDWPTSVPAVTSRTYRPQAPAARRQVASTMPRIDKKSTSLVADNMPPVMQRTPTIRHSENSGVVIAAAYQPDMDRQFERNPGKVAEPASQPVEIPGDDVQIADADPTPPVTPVHPMPNVPVEPAPASRQGPVTHTYVAKLTALPPDPNQVLTRADMARNRAVFTSGYDRSTLKSMERKETSILLIRGTF